jgi:hypothetical protein
MKGLRSVCFLGLVLFLTLTMNAPTAQGQSRTRSLMMQEGIRDVCHATGSRENPYELVKVSDNGEAHLRHPADIMPAPADGCPGPSGVEPNGPEPVPEPLTMLLFGAGVAGAGYAARRLKNKS